MISGDSSASQESAFSLPVRLPILLPGEAHLWRAEERSLRVERARQLLIPDELARADRLRLPILRERFAVFRAILRLILARYLNIEPRQISLSIDARGKPALDVAGEDLHFNLSHSGGWLAVIVCRSAEAGVDLENVQKQTQALEIALRYFTEAEQFALRNCPEDLRALRFFELWTAREAVLKAEGVGLAGLPNVLQLSAAWRLHRFSPAPDYVGAVALRPGFRLAGLHHFSPCPDEIELSGSA